MEGEEHVENENTPSQQSGKQIRNSILANFRKITHDKEKIRLKSGVDLVKYISKNKDTENGKIELKYALGRLIRGLGASKNTSKVGFYTVLVGLLNCVDINLSEIFEHVKTELHSSGSNSKSENADISAGQILLYGAIIRTNLYENANANEKKYILEQLLVAGKKRDYLYLTSIIFIIELCRKINENEFNSVYWPLLKPELENPWQEQNIDSLYLLYSLKDQYPNIINKKVLKQLVGSDEIYLKSNLKTLVNILLNVRRITVANHPFYEIMCQKLVDEEQATEFVMEMDENLMKYNYNRHLIATMILTYLIKHLKSPDIVPSLLCKNYIQHTLQYFKSLKSKGTDTLQKVTYSLFETIIDALKKEDTKSNTKIQVLKTLLFYPGIFIFEKITRSKIVQHIISTLDFEGVDQLAILYKEMISRNNDHHIEEEKHPWLNNDRIYASQLLVKLFTHTTIIEKLDWKVEQLKFLLELSLFKTKIGRNVGVDLAGSLKGTFYHGLALKLSKLNELRSLLSNIVNAANNHLNKGDLLRNPLTDEALEMFNKTYILTQKLESKHKKLYVVFHTLFLHMSLQLFTDTKLALESLQELHSCYERIRTEKKHPDQINAEDPLWIEVVVDLFLNLLSHKSYLLRNLINSVFPHLCTYINATAMQQILDTLDPKNEENPLITGGDDSGSEDEDAPTDNDEEASTDNDEEAPTDNDEDESEESDQDEEEVSDIEDNVNDKLKMAVQMALGGYKSDEESVDIDEMSETEGKKLDEALSSAFKLFKPNVGRKGNKQKKEDEALTHFRARVLDLIELYLDSEPSMYLTLEIMIVLLRCLEFAIKNEHERPFSNRLKSCLKKLTNTKKFCSVEDVDHTKLSDLFNSLLQKGTKNYYILQEMNDKISDCCLFIIRCSDILDSVEEIPKKVKKQLKKEIVRTITESLEMYFTKRECFVPYNLFRNILQSNWNGNFNLIPLILQYVFSENARAFRKNQAIELAKLFFANSRLFASQINTDDLNEHIDIFYNNTVNFFSNIENPNAKEKYVRELMSLLAIIKKCPTCQDKVNWTDLSITLKEYRASVQFPKGVANVYKKLFKIMGIDGIVILKKNLVKLDSVKAKKSEENAHENIIKHVEKKRVKRRNDTTNESSVNKKQKINILN